MLRRLLQNKTLQKLCAGTAAVLVWQLAAMALGQPLLLPAPLKVAQRLWELLDEAEFWLSVISSLGKIALGVVLAFTVAGLLAALAGRWKPIAVLVQPYMSVIKAVPVASFIILCLIAAGSRWLSVVIAFLMVLPVVYTNLLEGFHNVDGKMLEMAKIFRLPYPRRLRLLLLPALRPYLLAAVRVGTGMAWKAGIAAEVIGIPGGSIGEKLYEAKIYLASGDLFAWTVVIVLLSVGFEKLVTLLVKLFYRQLERG